MVRRENEKVNRGGGRREWEKGVGGVQYVENRGECVVYVHVSLKVAPRICGGILGDGLDGLSREELDLEGTPPSGGSAFVKVGHLVKHGDVGVDVNVLDPDRILAVNVSFLAESRVETKAGCGDDSVPGDGADFQNEGLQVQKGLDQFPAFGSRTGVYGVEDDNGLIDGGFSDKRVLLNRREREELTAPRVVL